MQFWGCTYIKHFTHMYLNLETECHVFYLTTLFPLDSLNSDALHPITTCCLSLSHPPTRWSFLNPVTPMHSVLPVPEAGMDSSHSNHIPQLSCLSAPEATWIIFKWHSTSEVQIQCNWPVRTDRRCCDFLTLSKPINSYLHTWNFMIGPTATSCDRWAVPNSRDLGTLCLWYRQHENQTVGLWEHSFPTTHMGSTTGLPWSGRAEDLSPQGVWQRPNELGSLQGGSDPQPIP